VFVREIQDMLHNTGYSAALFSLVDLPGAAELLAALLADGRAASSGPATQARPLTASACSAA
jgi:hypothetical protein